MKKTFATVFLIVLLLGCEELEQPNLNQFVVEGFITADFTIDDIKIKETVSLNDEIEDIPVSDAVVILSKNGEGVTLDYDLNSKKYFDATGSFQIEVGSEVEIEVIVNETVATSSSIVPEKPTGLSLSKDVLVIPTLQLDFSLRDEITRLFEEEVSTLTWQGVPGRSYYVVIETQEQELDPILPSGIPAESQELLASFRFISAPSEATSFDIIGVALETYGRHVAKVYSVNQEYVDLFNSETQDSRDLNEPPSNINNGLGIFSAFAVDSLEFVVSRE